MQDKKSKNTNRSAVAEMVVVSSSRIQEKYWYEKV